MQDLGGIQEPGTSIHHCSPKCTLRVTLKGMFKQIKIKTNNFELQLSGANFVD